jgi:hypothetical protein
MSKFYRLAATFVCIAFPLVLKAQHFKWARLFETYPSIARAAEADPWGNVLAISHEFDTIVHLEKTDPDGNLVWTYNFHSLYLGKKILHVDAAGNSYVFLNYETYMEGDGFSVHDGGCGYLIAKISPQGETIWAKTFHAAEDEWTWGTMSSDADQNLYVAAGHVLDFDVDPGPGAVPLGEAPYGEGYILKLNADGEFVWVRTIEGNGYTAVYDIECDPEGNIFTYVYFLGSADLDPGAGDMVLTEDGLNSTSCVQKLDPDGQLIWVKRIGNANSGIQAIDADSAGNVVVAGSYSGLMDADPGSGVWQLGSETAFENVYLLKLDGAGQLEWAGSFENFFGSGFEGLECDGQNNVYLCYRYIGDFDADPGPGTQIVAYTDPNSFFTGKFSPEGELAGVIAAPGPNLDPFAYIAPYGNSLYFSSSFWNNCDADMTEGVHMLYDNGWGVGSYKGYVAKYVFCEDTDTLISVFTNGSYTFNGVTYTSSGLYTQTIPNALGCDSLITLKLKISGLGLDELAANDIGVFPNPFHAELFVEAEQTLELTLLDLQGQVLFEEKSSVSKTVIPAEAISPGIYLLRIRSAENEWLAKVIKE